MMELISYATEMERIAGKMAKWELRRRRWWFPFSWVASVKLSFVVAEYLEFQEKWKQIRRMARYEW